jgi:short-subunit dehydrogenase
MVERRRGHVVLMASLAGKVAAAKMSIYAATKFGLRGFGHALRAELRGTGVGVSLVSPIYVREAGMWAETGQRSPIGEVTPEQVAEAVLRAVRQDRSEVTVAPLVMRAVSRVPMAFPELLHTPLGRRGGNFPDEAVERQRVKR